jgi:hypothetical protein
VSEDEAFLKVAALKVIKEFTASKYDEARTEAAQYQRPGDRKRVVSPLDGTRIGDVSTTDPSPRSLTTDEQAIADWMMEHNYRDNVETVYEVTGGPREIQSVLFTHAPHLLKRVKRVKRDALMRIHADTVAVGQPIGPSGEADMPGVTLEEQEAVVSCRPDPDSALLAVMELIQNRRLLLDGTIPVLEQGQ